MVSCTSCRSSVSGFSKFIIYSPLLLLRKTDKTSPHVRFRRTELRLLPMAPHRRLNPRADAVLCPRKRYGLGWLTLSLPSSRGACHHSHLFPRKLPNFASQF